MESYLSFANSPVLGLAAAAVIVFVLVQAVLFLSVAVRRGKAAGIPPTLLRKAFRAGVTTSLIPSLPIVLALIAMAPVLGTPISWMRLSVIGSAPYELMAAGIGAKTMGVDSLGGAGFTPTVFANAVWVMCAGSFWAIFLVAALYKGIKRRYSMGAKGDARWREILTGACFMGVFALFMADPITNGGTDLVTFLIAAVVMVVFLLLITRRRMTKLKEFALPVSMLAGMTGCVLWTHFLG